MKKIKIVKDFIPISNQTSRPRYDMDPQYITIHNTGNSRKGADAKMHTQYIDSAKGYISWHFTVDDKIIYQELPCTETGWHAGDGNGDGNMKSIGIEICENSNIDWINARSKAIELIIYLMDIHNIPIENVVPHQHWSGKYCPHKILDEGWDDFINDIVSFKDKTITPQWKIDGEQWLRDNHVLSTKHNPLEQIDMGTLGVMLENFYKQINKIKSEETKPIQPTPPEKPQIEWKSHDNSQYATIGELQVAKTIWNNIYLQAINKQLHVIGAVGCNFPFQDGDKVVKTGDDRAIWSLAYYKGKPIGGNSYSVWTTRPDIKRSTLIVYNDGSMEIKRINNISELDKNCYLAISGYGFGLYKEELIGTDITYKTNHTALGFKHNEIYEMVMDYCTLDEMKVEIDKLELDGFLFGDGGKSSQFLYPGLKGMTSSRPLAAIVGFKKL